MTVLGVTWVNDNDGNDASDGSQICSLKQIIWAIYTRENKTRFK